jgi:gag-polypeptide of LTR copia-type
METMTRDLKDINKIPILTGAENYREWANAVTTHLFRENSWAVIEGTSVKPTEPATVKATRSKDGEDTIAAEEKARTEYRAELKEWSTMNSKALGAIRSGLSPGILDDVADVYDAKIVWDYLTKYRVSASVQSFEGIKTAMTTHYDNCANIQDYIHKMTAGITKLKRVLKKGESWPESATIQFLLANLGETWDVFLTSYLTSRYSVETTTLDEVNHVLIQEEMRMKFMDNGSTNMADAHKGKKPQANRHRNDTGTQSSSDSQKSEDKKRDIVCHHCGKKGHKRPDCWELHPELKGKARNGRDQNGNDQNSNDQNGKNQHAGSANALIGQAPHPNDGGIVGLMTATANYQCYDDNEVGFVKLPQIGVVNHLRRDDWIIDSGSTEHLVSTPDLYVKGSVKPFRKGIQTATGQLTISTMSGDVEVFLLQPHGGTRKLTLKDVLFVPDVKINLLGTIRLGKRGIGVNLLPNEVVLTHIPTMDVFGYGDIVRDQYLLRTEHHGSASVATAFDKVKTRNHPRQSIGRRPWRGSLDNSLRTWLPRNSLACQSPGRHSGVLLKTS